MKFAVDAEGTIHRVEHVVGSVEPFFLEEKVDRGFVELRHLRTVQIDAELEAGFQDEW